MEEKMTSTSVCPHCGKSLPVNQLGQHMSSRHSSSADPTQYIQRLTNNTTVQSLYRSARRGEQRTLRRSTFGKFKTFEREVKRLCQLHSAGIPRPDLVEAQAMCPDIRSSLAKGNLRIMPKPRKKQPWDHICRLFRWSARNREAQLTRTCPRMTYTLIPSRQRFAFLNTLVGQHKEAADMTEFGST